MQDPPGNDITLAIPMTIPKVSVCIDVFNYGSYLPEAIESVLSQDFRDFELIVVDDCSEDESFAIAQGYAAKDSRVVARRNSANLGMVGNRNACLGFARGDFIKILHADDYFCTGDALGKMAAVLKKNPGVSLAACAVQDVGRASNRALRRSVLEACRPVPGTHVINRCLRDRRNLIGSPSATIFRRERGLRGFDEAFFNSADWEMWFHLLEQGSFVWVSEPLVAYRRHVNQQTEKDKATLTEARDHLQILDRYLERPYVRLSPLGKRYLRRRAITDFAIRSRKLGLETGPAGQVDAISPVIFGYGQYLKQRRFVESIIRRFTPADVVGKRMGKFPAGLNVAGFLKGEYGVGDSSRAYGRTIRESGMPAAFLNIPNRNHRNLDSSFDGFSTTNPYAVNLMAFSFDYARRFYRDRGRKFFKDRHNIAIWYWELEKFPARWHEAFDYYDEIWTPTAFCQKSLKEISPVPVFRIGYPLDQEEMPQPDREGFGFSPDSFLFLFNFDFHSEVERKNPRGLIEAFGKAFDAKKEPACLILKTINSRHYPEAAGELRRLAEGLNIIWINEHLDGARMKQLFATADCYVSLHRSEGLGLGMARAMSYGKPVIATGYSGNLDFTTPENSLLVRYRLAELDQDHGVYEKGNFWAEPDTDHAAGQMRWVFENPGEAARLGQLANADLQKIMNPAATFGQIRRRLGEIDARFKSL